MIKMVVGVLLVVLALREWRERPTSGDRAELPKWMAGVDSMMPRKALVLGLLLSAVVPKNLLLALGRSHRRRGGVQQRSGRSRHRCVHGDRHIDRGGTGCRPSRGADANARAIREATGVAGENNVAIMVVLLLVIGVVMIGNSIASLTRKSGANEAPNNLKARRAGASSGWWRADPIMKCHSCSRRRLARRDGGPVVLDTYHGPLHRPQLWLSACSAPTW